METIKMKQGVTPKGFLKESYRVPPVPFHREPQRGAQRGTEIPILTKHLKAPKGKRLPKHRNLP